MLSRRTPSALFRRLRAALSAPLRRTQASHRASRLLLPAQPTRRGSGRVSHFELVGEGRLDTSFKSQHGAFKPSKAARERMQRF